MDIYPNISIVDLALRYKDILIIGDLQFGQEEHLNAQGIFVPRFQTEDILKRIRNLLIKNKDIHTIIFNGDIKHEFGRISRQEWQSISQLIEELAHTYTLIMIKGNHDVLIEPIIKKFPKKVQLVPSYVIDDILITHGDKIHPAPQKTIIIAHEHPAISFHERPNETFKCFLKGHWKRHTLLVMPSFTTLTIGSDISKERKLSPYLPEDMSNFDVYIVADVPYHFGKLRNIL